MRIGSDELMRTVRRGDDEGGVGVTGGNFFRSSFHAIIDQYEIFDKKLLNLIILKNTRY